MLYTLKKASGDAGEYFFAYKIASVLKWPCRLTGIDIGIDAQVEVMDEKQFSTGQFIAFQVKATSKEEKDHVYVNPQNVEYWKDLGLPVYVVLVDLSKAEMYLHFVDPQITYPVTPKGQVRIDFDLAEDVFSEDSVDDLREKAGQSAASHIDDYLSNVLDGAQRIKDAIAALDGNNPDGQVLCDLVEERHELRGQLDQATALVEVFKVRKAALVNAKNEFNESYADLQDIVTNHNFATYWDDDGEIRRFSREDYNRFFSN
ncbi:DUF4365 domain-containing protein [Paraburkholderia diazotrophica]|uniref:DUF4365 domain-containing protein n=1 Tax=Paraburkholderia diazotrophica TaxID=667676 RepID=UPI003177C861